MLHELRVENLLLMDRAELRLTRGLNVLTGETGAGKTMLAQALDLLLGGRARAGIVRGGAAEAYVEGVFSLPPDVTRGEGSPVPDGAEELVLARRVWPDGRTRAYVCGRTATLVDLRELGGRVLAFYGQHEHRKLMLAGAQLDILDAFCGDPLPALRERLAGTYEQARRLESRAEELRRLAGARERDLDLLSFELDEIEAVDPCEQEQESLTRERDRLRHLGVLQASAAAAAQAISPQDGELPGGAALLGSAASDLERAASVDPGLAPLVARLRAVGYEAEDIGGELRSYLGAIEAPPGRLEEVEERLAQFARLQRKHGASIADVLAHARRCRERRDELQGAGVSLDGVETGLAGLRSELADLAAELTAVRRAGAPDLARAVRERLAELAMADARFEVEVRPRPQGCGPGGADLVELALAPNPGLPMGPLREIASGGELSRVMLALLSVAHGRAGEPGRSGGMLVFDEIDAGVGGHTARAVGEHLRELARGRQILCITHLPQVAAFAARHFTISKDTGSMPARTTVTSLAGSAVVGELVRMLGAEEGDKAASRHARELLKAA
ncbi:MAG: DNA repair protein RecN [Solirubrobacteraceae bacterium]